MAETAAVLEAQRLENIQRNRALLQDLGIHRKHIIAAPKPVASRPAKKRKLDFVNLPSRSSARIASAPVKHEYLDPESEEDKPTRRSGKRKSAGKANVKREARAIRDTTHDTEATSAVPTKDVEALRDGWARWTPAAGLPTRDEDSTFHFDDQPTFTPNKSPEEMLREGCFGGSYFRPLYSRRLGITVSDDWRELPEAWTAGLDIGSWLTSSTYNPDINKYKVSCGQSIEEWEAAGWINHTYDVRGWFQWYCRFFVGRRCDDDERQVSRWRKCVGETGRWRRMLLKKYVALGIREVFDDGEEEEQIDVSPVVHQTCHHWAFEVRQNVLDAYWRTGR
ncbi:MAG: hypothetical protein HETSPECPRED_009631 [Heterodermia speciosa]|uniref:Vegetatible incompatibility protein HET-E-1 n=1 Tax=Heterodermia speciosa TaxID=116794 RepID=A0A8H3EWJ7_9LECA|nr:MAG: hypothetical protein HETSPECPRED_009631 [Heterodermia speciosa]